MRRLPRVVVMGTGGSIATLGKHELDFVDYPDTLKLLAADELVEQVPWLKSVAEVVPIGFRALGSSRLSMQDWIDLNGALFDGLETDPVPDGIVVTHGTATLEETAFFLHLVLKTSVPVVLVGAMRPTTSIASDAHLNLLNAVRVAATPEAHGMGVLVVMDGTIHSARDVTKGSNWRVGTFESPLWGPLGMVWPNGRVELHRRPAKKHTASSELELTSRGIGRIPIVDIVTCYAGADRASVDAAIARSVDGIVLNGLPPGVAALGQQEAVRAAVGRGIAVVQASRALGAVILRTESQRGLVSANDLSAHKARILAMLALRQRKDLAWLQHLYDTH